MVGSQLPHYGVQAQIVEEAFALKGITVEYTFYPPARSLEHGQKGSMNGVVGMPFSKKNATGFVFSQAIIQSPMVFFHHREVLFNWQNLSDLSGHTVGLLSDSHYESQLKFAIENQAFAYEYRKEYKVNFKKLVIGRVTLFPYDLHRGYFLLKRNLPTDKAKQITHHKKPIQLSTYHLFLSKKHPDHLALVKTFNEGFNQLKASGRYEQIIKKHMFKLEETSVIK